MNPCAKLKSVNEDFVVTEQLGFEPSGEGQHRLLWIEKSGQNTEWVARQLAKQAGIPARDVGYSGLKDRNAVTFQWFSVDLAGKPEPNWSDAFSELEEGYVKILRSESHHRKLRTGTHVSNGFQIILRDVSEQDLVALDERVALAKQGVANYFGAQRFGHDGKNIQQAYEMITGQFKPRKRALKSILMSAARAHLFNEMLKKRFVDLGGLSPRIGDVMQMSGASSVFTVDELSDDIQQRFSEQDIHVALPLWGEGDFLATGEMAQWYADFAQAYAPWIEGLKNQRVDMAYRSSRLIPRNLKAEGYNSYIKVEFDLPRGAYATVVCEELVSCLKS